MLILINGCAVSPPQHIENICTIFAEKKKWYRAAEQASRRWGSSIPLLMAIIYQESKFISDNRPPRRKILGFIPGSRPSTAYGYAQALDTTWQRYRIDTGQRRAQRDNFAHAVDFVGWYNALSWRVARIHLNDARRLYLAYHEGQEGYRRGTYRKKKWLQNVATKVQKRARTYAAQLRTCERSLKKKKRWWWFFS